MSVASSSSSVRNLLGSRSQALAAFRSSRTRSKMPDVANRQYAASAAAVETQPVAEFPPAHAPTTTSSRPRIPHFPIAPGATITPTIAQQYLSHLLRLPENRQFPPELALQILTHKSYRLVHQIRHAREGSASEPSGVAHNTRLSFLGRRAIASYLAIFVHEAIGTSTQLKDMDFCKGKSLEEKLEAMRHVNNIGREVGRPWGIEGVMRWDRNQTGTESGHVRIRGMAVESVLGGIFSQFGSPAAHRAFHTLVLPYLSDQVRDQALKEKIEEMRVSTEKLSNGGILLP